MANKIIFDDVSSPTRFNNGLSMEFIQTADLILHDTKNYSTNRMLCCSPVKDTLDNWFYIYPKYGPPLKFLQAWLDEISPVFPRLKIQIVKSDCKRKDVGFYKDPSLNENFHMAHMGSRGFMLSMVLDFSEESNLHYSYTKKKSFTKGSFSELNFLIKMFIDYCLEIKSNISRRFLGEVIEEFAFTKIFQIKEEFSRPHVAMVRPTGGNGNGYRIEVCNIVDINSVTIEKIITYLTDIVSTNLDVISLYLETVNKNPALEEDSKIYIQALYSQKKYKVEAYLAHHLIRAGLSFEFKDFIDQYFLIKKALPNEFFWNLIFLTQFGFNFYYYYWLTDDRTFKLTDADTFATKAKNFLDTSSQYFLREAFHIDQNVLTYNHLRDLYCAGKFKEVARAMGSTIRIEVKPSRKSKVTTLRIADSYEVCAMDEKYYHIRGDDFRMRKYLKNNFNIINKKAV